jgi:predicted Zn-ribbon and HTH transcriptional regulator
MNCCPHCRSEQIRRSQRRGFVERGPLTLLSVKPFRCKDCRHRFFRWPVTRDGLTQLVYFKANLKRTEKL